ncbi:class I SAM-dependent methyltransferase [Magnetospirillum sp. SS-4]|uniref:class I SAM-dependent methyltransferase n=1 Tax=Magnetospirillum sp. SS-4 TaxID=2681465 RepID=UPI00137E593B|nr:class I SAM-dependent methyltransferase [Magnetospirillum sp. SS-4]CAA7617715.1 conserved hypothetical protein [Magnetospirillum sp. SS-4]
MTGQSIGESTGRALADGSTRDFWTTFNVTEHHEFSSAAESLEYFHWRNDQYFNYINLMPVDGQDGRSVLDFGCGPGHDLVGFGVYSRPSRLVGADISPSSLAETRYRLSLHDIAAELVLLDPEATRLPFDDASFDHIHCSGVLHHTPDPEPILRELRRVLRPDGSMNVMVYNRDSLWLHLNVAWQLCIEQGLYPVDDLMAAFARSTDTVDCPISVCYRPEAFKALCARAGLAAELTGVAVSMLETRLFHHRRFAAIADRRLPPESRRFLLDIELDRQGYPMRNGQYAGIDACYRLSVASEP